MRARAGEPTDAVPHCLHPGPARVPRGGRALLLRAARGFDYGHRALWSVQLHDLPPRGRRQNGERDVSVLVGLRARSAELPRDGPSRVLSLQGSKISVRRPGLPRAVLRRRRGHRLLRVPRRRGPDRALRRRHSPQLPLRAPGAPGPPSAYRPATRGRRDRSALAPPAHREGLRGTQAQRVQPPAPAARVLERRRRKRVPRGGPDLSLQPRLHPQHPSWSGLGE
mmetsp:Transcript_13920/g.41457  ORF Transcript_13920/g.41457 Transcript_13920/m.41457 type:complete len:224 (-) Transcript_13920:20-691(-)